MLIQCLKFDNNICSIYRTNNSYLNLIEPWCRGASIIFGDFSADCSDSQSRVSDCLVECLCTSTGFSSSCHNLSKFLVSICLIIEVILYVFQLCFVSAS